MENLYKTLNEKREQINRFETKADEDYYLHFIEGFVRELINETIHGLKMRDIRNVDSIENVSVTSKIYFLQRSEDVSLYSSVNPTEKTGFIRLPKSDGEEIKNRIITFFKDAGLLSSYSLKYQDDPIIITGGLNKLIAHYCVELSKEDKAKESFAELASLTNKVNAATSSLASELSDDVHAKRFEEEFLDHYIVRIVKNRLKDLNKRNFAAGNAKNISIEGKIVIAEEGQDFGHMNIKRNEVDEVLIIVKEFMQDYGLGTVEYTYCRGMEIEFKTNLADLMDAYYMEKQRIAHYTSGDYLVKEKDPNAKKLKLKRK